MSTTVVTKLEFHLRLQTASDMDSMGGDRYVKELDLENKMLLKLQKDFNALQNKHSHFSLHV